MTTVAALQLIEQQRKARGWSLRTLASEAGIADTTIGRWYADVSHPEPRHLASVARALDLDPALLLAKAGYINDPTAADVLDDPTDAIYDVLSRTTWSPDLRETVMATVRLAHELAQARRTDGR